MILNRKDLLKIFDKIMPGIDKKDSLEGMSHFYFSGTNIITYNDRISIQHPLKTDFDLFVKATDIYKILSKLKTDDITLVGDKDKLNISCKTMKANLATVSNDEVISRIKNVASSLSKIKWKKLPTNFISNLILCSYTASTQESDRTLTCVYVNGSDCVASDNNRISHAKMEEPVDELFVKASEIKNLASINPVEYAVSKSWIHFKNSDGCIFSIIKVSGNFPDFLPFFDFEGTEVNLPSDILEGVDIASVLVSDDPAIQFKISKGFCHISVQSEAGTMKFRSKIDYNGKDVSFTINPDFLKQMMEHSSSITVSNKMAKLHTDDENFSMVTALYA